MLTETEYSEYTSRIGAPISEKNWSAFHKLFSKTKVGDFFYVYSKGGDDIVKISSVDHVGNRYQYTDKDGHVSGPRYIWTLIRKARKEEIKEKMEAHRKHLYFYQN